MEDIYKALSTIAVGVIGALGALLISAVPRAWQWLGARIHGENVLLLRQTIENRAALAVKATREENMPVEIAINQLMIAHIRDVSLPKTVRKLKLDDEDLRQMSMAAFYRVSNGLPPP